MSAAGNIAVISSAKDKHGGGGSGAKIKDEVKLQPVSC